MRYISFMIALTISPALAATYSPADAKNHLGETATVEGTASVYVAKGGNTFIDLGGRGRDAPFTGIIFNSKVSAVPDVKSYEGKTVGITGTIKDYQGKAEIVIDDPGKIKAK